MRQLPTVTRPSGTAAMRIIHLAHLPHSRFSLLEMAAQHPKELRPETWDRGQSAASFRVGGHDTSTRERHDGSLR